jgi:transcriptional regulator with GAF, ATPase, and Fis domain/serine/threonine protein kinase
MIIDGKYEVVKKLGSGLSGEVLLAKDNAGVHALKFLKSGQAGFSKEEAVANFKNEFALLKELTHPNIALIQDFGYIPEEDQYYFTTEFIDGMNLLDASEGKSPEEIETLFVQALRALEYLHAHAIFHFDLKPQNILVGKNAKGETTVKIIDFGLAGYKPKGKMAGTPSYMAPEIILGERPDGRSDLYSIGVVFYECLTGLNPFRGEQLTETLNRQQTHRADPPSKLKREIPKYLDNVLAKLLAKNPSERYSSAAAVTRELNQFSGKNYPIETPDTLLAYLPGEGQLIGRQKELQNFEQFFDEFSQVFQEGVFKKLVLLAGAQGNGKSRLLKEFRFYAQLHNAPVFIWKKGVTPEIQGPQVILADDLQAEEYERLQNFWLSYPSSLLTFAASDQKLEAKEDHDLWEIPPFNKNELKDYVASMTGLSAPPAPLIDELLQRTHGNPLFVSEILMALIRKGLLGGSQGRWKATTYDDLGVDFSKIEIPSNLSEFLLGQFLARSEAEKKILRVLSLLGREGALEGIGQFTQLQAVPEIVAHLTQEGILEREERSLAYDFKNPLLRKAIVESLDPEEKASLHRKIAKGFEIQKGREEEYLVHLSQSAQGMDSLRALTSLGEKALSEGRSTEAKEYLKQAYESSHKMEASAQINVSLKLGDALLKEGDLKAAGDLFDSVRVRLKEIKSQKENISWKIDIYEKLGVIYLTRHAPDKASEIFSSALALLEEFPLPLSKKLVIENYLGRARIVEGRLDEALKIFEETQKAWQKDLSDAEKKEVLNNELATVYHLKQEYAKALAQFQKDLQFYQTIQHHFHMARIHYHLGEVYYAQKNLPKTIEEFKKCVEISKAHRYFELIIRAYNGLGNVYNLNKEAENSLHYYGRALSIAQKIQDINAQAVIASNMGIIFNESGQPGEALPHLTNAIFLLERIPHKTSYQLYFLSRAKLEMGEVLRKQKKMEAARDALRDALSLIGENESLKNQLYWVHAAFVRLYTDQSRNEEALESLDKARTLAHEKEEKADLAELEKILQGAVPAKKEEPARRMPAIVEHMEDSGRGLATLEKEYETILTLNNYLNAEHNLDFLFKTILNYALELSQAERGLILLMDDKEQLEVQASVNAEVNANLAQISTSIAERVLNSGEAVQTDDASGDQRFNEYQSVMILKLRSILCLPIQSRKKTVGVLYLDNRYRPGAFKAANLKVLSAFCDQVGIAIENAKLINRYQQVEQELRKKLAEAESEASQYESILKEEAIAIPTKYSYDKIIAKSKAMYDIFRMLDKITETNLAVFIHGETGTGKELIAKALHYNNKARKEKRFVAINCGAIPANLMESELFGHKAGSFTGAMKDKKGLFLEADEGTIFLDEVAELDMSLQVKLLRVLEESEITAVGDTKTLSVNVRVVAASHKNLEEEIKAGRFREDLFYRICQIKIDLPPLRERREDVPLLSEKFMENYRKEHGIETKLKIAPSLMKKLLDYDWPGNVRELENIISVATALADHDELTYESLPTSYGIRKNLAAAKSTTTSSASAGGPVSTSGGKAAPSGMRVLIDGENLYDSTKSWEDYEKLIVAKAYQNQGSNPAKAAEVLDLSLATMYKRVKELDLNNLQNPLYHTSFVYDPKLTLKDYVKKVFSAANEYSGNHPYTAIKWLGVSQGYFYKILKELKSG